MRAEELFGLWQVKLRAGKYLLLNPLLSLGLSTEAYKLLSSTEHDQGSPQICLTEASLDFTYRNEDCEFLLQVARSSTGRYEGTLLNRDNNRRRSCQLTPFSALPTAARCPFCTPLQRITSKRRRTQAAPKTPANHLGYCVRWIARTSSGFDIIDDEDIETAFREYLASVHGQLRAHVEDPRRELDHILQFTESEDMDADEARIYHSDFGHINFDDFSLSSTDVRATGTDVVYRVSFAWHTGQVGMATHPVEGQAAQVLSLDSDIELVTSLIYHKPHSPLPPFQIVASRGRPSVLTAHKPCCDSCVSLCSRDQKIICGSVHYRRTRKDPEDIVGLMRTLYRSVKLSHRTAKSDEEEDVCVICLDSFVRRKIVGFPKCRHLFHPECANEYVRRTAAGITDCVRCPVCNVMQTRVYGNSPKAFMYWSGSPQSGWRVGISVLPGTQKPHLHPRPGEKHKPWLAMFLSPSGPDGVNALALIKTAFVLGQLLEVKASGNSIGFAYGISVPSHLSDDAAILMAECRRKLESVGIEADAEVEIKSSGGALAKYLDSVGRPHAGDGVDDDDSQGNVEDDDDDDEDVTDSDEDDDEDDDSPADIDTELRDDESDWLDLS